MNYSKEFLIEAYISRFLNLPSIEIEDLEFLEQNAINLYDRVGKEKFRTYASLDADAIKEYLKWPNFG